VQLRKATGQELAYASEALSKDRFLPLCEDDRWFMRRDFEGGEVVRDVTDNWSEADCDGHLEWLRR
jgi:hypothetical protein